MMIQAKVVHFLFCYFLQELEDNLSRQLTNENCLDTNDVIQVCGKDNGGDNIGAIFLRDNLDSKTNEEEILLPPGMVLKELFGIELSAKDVGNALQILEFCRVFGKVC